MTERNVGSFKAWLALPPNHAMEGLVAASWLTSLEELRLLAWLGGPSASWPASRDPWRLSWVRLTVVDAPERLEQGWAVDVRGRAVVAHQDKGWWLGEERLDPATERLFPGGSRVQLVLLPGGASVQDVVEGCAAFQRARPFGACILGTGSTEDWEQWADEQGRSGG
jgi:hypothetical protein